MSEVWGSAFEHQRTWRLMPKRYHRKCGCCGQRATHVGCANGVALMSGCEWQVRRWIRDPMSIYREP
jgi:hypothetical protein